jgi:hypothetical protein
MLRPMRAILCLGTVAFLVVSLRYGAYEYFHGDAEALAFLVDVLRAN